MSTKIERADMKFAQKLTRRLEKACDSGALYDWFAGTHIRPRQGSEDIVIFGDCPLAGLVYDAKPRIAYIYYGCGKARVPKRAIPELHDFFSTLHNC